MPKIRSAGTSVPATRIDQAEAEAFARLKFSGRIPDLERLMPLFANSGIATRYFA
ncbi:type III polyketide synthase, partial [bacterium]|nr:type III polyketide synthase [bacterium]